MKKTDLVEQLYAGLAVPLLRTFTGLNLFFHLAAIGVTYFFVSSGIDWSFYLWAGQDPWVIQIAFSAAIVGIVLPVVLPLSIYAQGVLAKDKGHKQVALVLMQAVIIALLVSSGYKAVTGRVSPEYTVSIKTASLHTMTSDISDEWRFGFMRGGVFDGWPSGHTTSAFALAVAAILISPKRKKLHIFLILYALYIGLGVGITIHWLSDAVAGMLVGIAVGRSVARKE